MSEYAEFIRRVEGHAGSAETDSPTRSTDVVIANQGPFVIAEAATIRSRFVEAAYRSPIFNIAEAATIRSRFEEAAYRRPIFKLYMHGGRLDPTTGPTTEEGDAIDGIGFSGSSLVGVLGIHSTFDDIRVIFETSEIARMAQRVTGWDFGLGTDDLEMAFTDGCLRIWNGQLGRFEFFSDWGLIA